MFLLILNIVTLRSKMKIKHYMQKKRVRALRQFKALYYSYVLFRAFDDDFEGGVLEENRINQLYRNNYLGTDTSIFSLLKHKDSESVLEIQNKLIRLDELSDELTILYDEFLILPVKNFIYWYKSFLDDLNKYDKNILQSMIENKKINGINMKLKKIEENYIEIEESLLLSQLLEKCKIKYI